MEWSIYATWTCGDGNAAEAFASGRSRRPWRRCRRTGRGRRRRGSAGRTGRNLKSRGDRQHAVGSAAAATPRRSGRGSRTRICGCGNNQPTTRSILMAIVRSATTSEKAAKMLLDADTIGDDAGAPDEHQAQLLAPRRITTIWFRGRLAYREGAGHHPTRARRPRRASRADHPALPHRHPPLKPVRPASRRPSPPGRGSAPMHAEPTERRPLDTIALPREAVARSTAERAQTVAAPGQDAARD